MEQDSQQRNGKFKGRDLKKYGISYEEVSFVLDDKEDKKLYMRAETFQQIIEFVKTFSLKAAYLMTIYKNILSGHRPFTVATFKALAIELDTTPRVLRRYAKDLEKEGLLRLVKLDPRDTDVDDGYIYTMGSKFKNWIWESTIFKMVEKDFVNKSAPGVNKSKEEKPQRVRSGPHKDTKGSVVDPQRVRSGPPRELQLNELIELLPKTECPAFSLPSINMPSVGSGDKETKVSSGDGNGERKKKDQPSMELQKEWLDVTKCAIPFDDWLKKEGRLHG